MGMSDWKKVLELAVSNPELIGALFFVLTILIGIVVTAASLAWLIRGLIAKERVEAINECLALASSQLQDLRQRLDLATAEQSKLQQQIHAHAAPEKIAATAASSLNSLLSA